MPARHRARYYRMLLAGIVLANVILACIFAPARPSIFDCAATPRPDTPLFLIGTSWRLAGVIVDEEQQSPSQPDQYLTFESLCKISGYDGCNAFAARVEVFEPDHYITSSQSQTARGCMWTAELPHAATGKVAYELSGDELRLYAPGDTSKIFVFTAIPYNTPSEFLK